MKTADFWIVEWAKCRACGAQPTCRGSADPYNDYDWRCPTPGCVNSVNATPTGDMETPEWAEAC